MSTNTKLSKGQPVVVWFHRTDVVELDKAAAALDVTRSAFVRKAALDAAAATELVRWRDRVRQAKTEAREQ